MGVVVFFAVVVLFFDPGGRPRRLGASVFVVVVALAGLTLFFDPLGRPRFLGAAVVVLAAGALTDFGVATDAALTLDSGFALETKSFED